jgi:hypothetical protein
MLLPTVFAVLATTFATSAVSAQDIRLAPAKSLISNDYGNSGISVIVSGELVRLRSNQFAIGGSRPFSFQEANQFIADPYIVNQLKRAIVMKRTAIGLGVGGAALTLVGIVCTNVAMADWNKELNDLERIYHTSTYRVGSFIGGIGSMSIITAIVLGSVSPSMVRKTIDRYNMNVRTGYYSELRLDFLTPTPGGMGMQLTF